MEEAQFQRFFQIINFMFHIIFLLIEAAPFAGVVLAFMGESGLNTGYFRKFTYNPQNDKLI